MVYVEKIVVKGKTYYKLVHAMRKGKKVTHRTKYLGKTLPPKARLEQLKKEFLKEIRGQKHKFLSGNDIEKIEKKKDDYRKEIKRLSPLEKKKQLKEFIIRFTYDSSKLSGVAVTLRQTYLILKEGIMPKNIQDLRTVKELENHEKGIITITKYKGKLDIKFIKKLHKILFIGVNDSVAGKLRDELQRNVKIAGTSYIPPKWQELKKELMNFFKWYESEKRKLYPLELAALIHLKIISIQPFVDGNSRLSRLLMNWILWKKQYPPIDIPVEDLEKYYNVLDRYQIEKEEKPFIEYVKNLFIKGL
ncbi:MAG: Fic family protein [Nanoarchaeota archaeon]|nr:Fic family protein [Nanoarchaeota archaeon]